jgi:hypothetical protein
VLAGILVKPAPNRTLPGHHQHLEPRNQSLLLVIQAILRHSNVNVTLGYYIKPQSADVIAMEKFEAEMAAQSLRDTDRTPNPRSGAMPKSVN